MLLNRNELRIFTFEIEIWIEKSVNMNKTCAIQEAKVGIVKFINKHKLHVT